MFQDLQAGHHGGHLGNWNGTNLAILNLHVAPMPPTMFGLNPTYRFGSRGGLKISKMATGGHLGYRNRRILAILNL